MKYLEMSLEELKKEKEIVEAEYRELKGKGMSLDLSRGKPGKKQIDMMTDMLTCLSDADVYQVIIMILLLFVLLF